MITLQIDGQKVRMELDTGAALSSISYNDYKKLNIKKKIHKTDIQLKTYTGELIRPIGMVFVKWMGNYLLLTNQLTLFLADHGYEKSR
jgi:hypothetical protein